MDRRKFLCAGAELGTVLATGGLLAAAPALAQPPTHKAKESVMPADRQTKAAGKARVFVTGSASGLGYGAAEKLLDQGHDVVVHVRSEARLPAVQDLVDKGAVATIGDLADIAQIRDLAKQVNDIGRMDAVIHNAGVISGPQLLVVNVTAPYLLTALIQRPQRLIYLSSAMHTGGRASLEGLDWMGGTSTGSYSDSKLLVTALTFAVARLWPEVFSNAVNPGWVPTRMGGQNAPDDLRLGHLTQEWLAVSDDAEARSSGGYWHHQKRVEPHPATRDVKFQERLLAELERATGTPLAPP